MINKSFFIYFISFILFNFLLSDNYIQLKKNITSLLNTTDIIAFNNNLLIATDGGLYSYNNSTFFDYREDLVRYNLYTLAINNNNLWIGNNNGGIIQIFNDQMINISNVSQLDIKDIYDIVFSNKYAFILASTYDDINQLEVYQYNIEDINNIYYISKLNIPFDSSIINDIELLNETLYVSLENSWVTANQLDNINFSDISTWSQFSGFNIPKFLIHNNEVIVASNNVVYSSNDSYMVDDFIDILISIDSNHIGIYVNNRLIIFNTLKQEIIKSIDIDLNYLVDNIYYVDDVFYFGLKNKGVAIYYNLTDTWFNYIPDSIFKNQFDSLGLTNSGDLVGVVNHRYSTTIEDSDLNQSGIFILENPLFINHSTIKNYYSYNGYYINNYPLTQSDYSAEVLNYWSGDNRIHSAFISSDNILYFSNSGIYPPSWLGHFEDIATAYNFELSGSTEYGGVVEVKISNDLNAQINFVWNRSENHLGGQYGIFDSNSTDGYMITNQIISDVNDNIWVVNPYSEYPNENQYNNWPISIKHNSNNWFHIKDDKDNFYIPKEIAIDNNSNLWISYLFSEDYSTNGIRMVQFNNILNNDDDIWYNNILNNELNNLDVYSLAISDLPDSRQVLWVMTNLGIKGFIINKSTVNGYLSVDFIPMQNNYYYGDLTFNEGCKLRVDNQNNIWVSTVDDGVRIIDNNGNILLNNIGDITVEKHGILSNIIYDLIFDDYGNVYIATDNGISIMETSYVKNISINKISVSPNPFIIGEDLEIIITNVPRESKIKIMNLSGLVVKEFNLRNYNKIIPWNGTDDKGNRLATGVYLVSANNNSDQIGSTKIVLLNK